MSEEPMASDSPIHTVDVRDDIRSGGDPFGKIMTAVSKLGDGDALVVIAPFEPLPLFRVMSARGFTHISNPLPNGDWQVRFIRAAGVNAAESPARPAEESSCGCSTTRAARIIDVDTRGLEPPGPLVQILETVATLPDNAEIRARTNRRPMHLYPELEARGFVGTTEEQSDGTFITHIRRR